MTSISYEDLKARLTDEATETFVEMVRIHNEAGKGDRFFIETNSFAGRSLLFVGPGSGDGLSDVDGGTLMDLVGYGLLHQDFSDRGTPNYRVSGEGQQFYRWLMEQQGSPVAQTEEAVRQLLEGDRFATEHSSAAHHLSKAFDLLWSNRTDDTIVSEIGDHLRKALMDITKDVTSGVAGDHEKPIELLEALVASKTDLAERERNALLQLVEFARSVLRLDHRLNHVRDEKDKGREAVTWSELRRAAFTTALVCYEIGQL